jgi:hypothetical protein
MKGFEGQAKGIDRGYFKRFGLPAQQSEVSARYTRAVAQLQNILRGLVDYVPNGNLPVVDSNPLWHYLNITDIFGLKS